MHPQIESGTELLGRLNKKPSLCGLEDTLFFKGPRCTDIIEISGVQSSAVLINTDHHFQTSKLEELMSNIVNNAVDTVSFTTDSIDVKFDKIAVVKNSLRNLHVINCYDSEQFAVTLRTLNNIFIENTKVALLAIDSITAYYWQDRKDNHVTVNAYVKNLLQLIKTHTAQFNVATIYTKLYKSIDNKGKKLTDNINYRIHLYKTYNSKNFTCTLETTQIVRKIHYSILSNGIRWKMDEK
ncbi:hypothetical protein QLX08_009280 [Tetragonisca angustula]|uniref:Uncharacterized protein n=1 Tax=Tetragonisca angustula TaxID=166442 RepID=A0AAW0ZJF0_9HYME